MESADEAYLNGSPFIVFNTRRRVHCELVAQPEDVPYLMAEKGLEADILVHASERSKVDIDITHIIAIWEKGLRPYIARSGDVAQEEATFGEIVLKLERDSDLVAAPFQSRLVEVTCDLLQLWCPAYSVELRRPKISTDRLTWPVGQHTPLDNRPGFPAGNLSIHPHL